MGKYKAIEVEKDKLLKLMEENIDFEVQEVIEYIESLEKNKKKSDLQSVMGELVMPTKNEIYRKYNSKLDKAIKTQDILFFICKIIFCKVIQYSILLQLNHLYFIN